METPWQTAERARIASRIEAEEHAFRAYAANIDYPAFDPDAALAPPPADEAPEDRLWVDDALPAGAKPQGDTADGGRDGWKWYSDADGPTLSGSAGWERNTRYQGQSFFTGATNPVTVREGDTVFANIYIEPGGNPQAAMIQVHTKQEGWEHRAIWGNRNAIPFGKVNTPSRKPMGGLPGREEWIRLEVPLAEIGLEPGDEIDGLAFTQKGGHIRWDAAGFRTTGAKALELAAARTAWERAMRELLNAGTAPAALPDPVAAALRVSPRRAGRGAAASRRRLLPHGGPSQAEGPLPLARGGDRRAAGGDQPAGRGDPQHPRHGRGRQAPAGEHPHPRRVRQPRRPGLPRHPRRAAAGPRGRPEQPPHPGPLADRPGPPADRPRHGEPHLAAALRHGAGEDQRGLRQSGRMALATRSF